MASNSNQHNSNHEQTREAAVNLIRERIHALYKNESKVKPRGHSELVDRFWQEHKDHPQPQAAWQQFYAGLSDAEKHLLWNEYNQSQAPRSHKHPLKKTQKVEQKPINVSNDATHSGVFVTEKEHKITNKIKAASSREQQKEKAKQLAARVITSAKREKKTPKINRKPRSKRHAWTPLLISVGVMLIWAFIQYNPLLFAFAKQYVSPGDTLQSPVIIDPSANVKISKEPRIIIPKINVDVPVVYDVYTRDEGDIQNALERGVVHYAGTGVPGGEGNNVIVGHSSNNFLNSGKYKFAFVLLDRLELNDTFILHYEGTRYIYKVTNKQVIEPTDFSLIQETDKPTTTLITCTPPGTSWRRLVIQGEQISPAPSQNKKQPNRQVETPEDAIVPGNAPSFWDRLF